MVSDELWMKYGLVFEIRIYCGWSRFGDSSIKDSSRLVEESDGWDEGVYGWW